MLTLRPRFLTLIFFQVIYSILKAHTRLNTAEREIHGVHEHTLNLFRDLLVLELELIEFATNKFGLCLLGHELSRRLCH